MTIFVKRTLQTIVEYYIFTFKALLVATAAFLTAALCLGLSGMAEDPHHTFIAVTGTLPLLIAIAGVIVLSLVNTYPNRRRRDVSTPERVHTRLLGSLQTSWFAYVALFASSLTIITVAALKVTTDSDKSAIATLQLQLEKLRKSEASDEHERVTPTPARPSDTEPIVASARGIFLTPDRPGTMAANSRVTLSAGEPLQLLLPTTLSEEDKTYYSVEVFRISPKPAQRLKEWGRVMPIWLDPGSRDPIGVLALLLPPALIGKSDSTLRITWRAPLFTADAASVTVDVHVSSEKKLTEH